MKISFEDTYELEHFIDKIRIEYAKEHSADYKKNLKETEITDEDWLGIYSCLRAKEITKKT